MQSVIDPTPPYLLFSAAGYKLKLSLLTGIIGVSTAAGASSLVFNGPEATKAVGDALGPVYEAISSFVGPQLTSIENGAKKIYNTSSEWASSIFNKSILGWLKTQQLENISKGFKALRETFGDWGSSLGSAITSVWEKKEDLSKYLNYETLASILVNIFEYYDVIREALSTFLGIFYMSFQHLLSPSQETSDQKSKGAAESFSSLVSQGLLGKFFSSAWSVAAENSEAIKDIKASQVKQLINYALSNADTFVKRVEYLKSQSQSQSQSSGWGKYKTSSELVNAILNNNWGNIVVGLLNFFASPFSSCKEKQSCHKDDVFLDTVKAIVEAFKGEAEGSEK